MDTFKYIIAKVVQGSCNASHQPELFDLYINIILHKFILASNSLIKDIHNAKAPNLYVNRITGKMYYIADICYSKTCIDALDANKVKCTYNLLCKMYNKQPTLLYVDATNFDACYIYNHNNIPDAVFCSLNELFQLFQINFQFNSDTYATFINLLTNGGNGDYATPTNQFTPDSSPILDDYPFTPMIQSHNDSNKFVTPPHALQNDQPPGAPKKKFNYIHDDYSDSDAAPLIIN